MISPYYLQITVTITCAALPCIAGAARLKQLDRPARIFYLLSATGLVTEITAFVAAGRYGNNLPVYNLFNLLQVMLLCLYFNYAAGGLHRHKWGWYIGLGSVLLGVMNMVFLQPVDTPNTYYFSYRMILVVLLTVMLLQGGLLPAVYTYRIRWCVHFWLALLLANQAILNMMSLSMYDFLMDRMGEHMYMVNLVIVLLSASFNIAYAIIFILYPKMVRNYGKR